MKTRIIISVFFIYSILILTSCDYYYAHKIKQNRGDTMGKVIGTEEGARGGFGLVYTFQVNDKIYKGRYNTMMWRYEDKFKGKEFPVVYYKDKPKYNLMIVNFPDFIDWNIPYEKKYYWTYKCVDIGEIYWLKHQDQIPQELKGTEPL